MSSKAKEILKMLAFILFMFALFFGFIFYLDSASPEPLEIYIVNSNKELVYYADTLSSKIQLHADEEEGFVYIIDIKRKSCTEVIGKFSLEDNTVIVKKSKTVEII